MLKSHTLFFVTLIASSSTAQSAKQAQHIEEQKDEGAMGAKDIKKALKKVPGLPHGKREHVALSLIGDQEDTRMV